MESRNEFDELVLGPDYKTNRITGYHCRHADGVFRHHNVVDGTVVRLRSGGPEMVAELSTRPFGEAHLVPVAWFNGNELCRDVFDWRVLTTAE